MLTLDDYRNNEFNNYLMESWGLDRKTVEAEEKAVLDRLYSMMSLKEQKELDNHCLRLNEFLAPLLRGAGSFLLGAVAPKLMKSFGNMLITPEEKEEIESAPKSGILSSLWWVIKKVGILVFIAALFYLGFRSETLRNMFPFLASVADKIGDYMKHGGRWMIDSIFWPAFKKVATTSKELAWWMIKKAFEFTGVTAALRKAYKFLEDTWKGFYDTMDTAGKAIADKIKGGGRAIRDAGSAVKDAIDSPLDAIKDKLRTPGGNPAGYNKTSKDPFGNINTKSPFPSTSQSDKDLDFLNSGRLRDFGKGGSGAFAPSGSGNIDAIKKALAK